MSGPRSGGGRPDAPQGFGLRSTGTIYRASWSRAEGGVWSAGEYAPWGEVGLSPAAAVLSYGLSVFEGFKAECGVDGAVRLFRVEDHAGRLEASARALLMPPFPAARLASVAVELIGRNRAAIPETGAGCLYVRPVLFADEPRLGLGLCDSFTLLVYVSPVGEMISHSRTDGVRLRVIGRERAAPGLGSLKWSGNYAAVLSVVNEARRAGFDDVLFAGPTRPGYVTETSGANLFVMLRSGVLVTPPLDRHLFPGVTRDSIVRLAGEIFEDRVEQRPIAIDEILVEADEVFCTGTAWSVVSVIEIEQDGRVGRFPAGDLRQRLHAELRAIQQGRIDDRFGWARKVEL